MSMSSTIYLNMKNNVPIVLVRYTVKPHGTCSNSIKPVREYE